MADEKRKFNFKGVDHDLDFFIRNIDANVERYLEAQTWSPEAKNKFKETFDVYRNSLQTGNLSINRWGGIDDSTGTLKTGEDFYVNKKTGSLKTFDEYNNEKEKNKKNYYIFNPSKQVASFINDLAELALSDKSIIKDPEISKFDIKQHGFYKWWGNRIDPLGSGIDFNNFIALDKYDDVNKKRLNVNRPLHLKEALENYKKIVNDYNYDFSNTVFKTKDDYIKLIDKAIEELGKAPFDANDLVALTYLGFPKDFLTTLFTEYESPMSDEAWKAKQKAEEEERRKIEEAEALELLIQGNEGGNEGGNGSNSKNELVEEDQKKLEEINKKFELYKTFLESYSTDIPLFRFDKGYDFNNPENLKNTDINNFAQQYVIPSRDFIGDSNFLIKHMYNYLTSPDSYIFDSSNPEEYLKKKNRMSVILSYLFFSPAFKNSKLIKTIPNLLPNGSPNPYAGKKYFSSPVLSKNKAIIIYDNLTKTFKAIFDMYANPKSFSNLKVDLKQFLRKGGALIKKMTKGSSIEKEDSVKKDSSSYKFEEISNEEFDLAFQEAELLYNKGYLSQEELDALIAFARLKSIIVSSIGMFVKNPKYNFLLTGLPSTAGNFVANAFDKKVSTADMWTQLGADLALDAVALGSKGKGKYAKIVNGLLKAVNAIGLPALGYMLYTNSPKAADALYNGFAHGWENLSPQDWYDLTAGIYTLTTAGNATSRFLRYKAITNVLDARTLKNLKVRHGIKNPLTDDVVLSVNVNGEPKYIRLLGADAERIHNPQTQLLPGEIESIVRKYPGFENATINLQPDLKSALLPWKEVQYFPVTYPVHNTATLETRTQIINGKPKKVDIVEPVTVMGKRFGYELAPKVARTYAQLLEEGVKNYRETIQGRINNSKASLESANEEIKSLNQQIQQAQDDLRFFQNNDFINALLQKQAFEFIRLYEATILNLNKQIAAAKGSKKTKKLALEKLLELDNYIRDNESTYNNYKSLTGTTTEQEIDIIIGNNLRVMEDKLRNIDYLNSLLQNALTNYRTHETDLNFNRVAKNSDEPHTFTYEGQEITIPYKELYKDITFKKGGVLKALSGAQVTTTNNLEEKKPTGTLKKKNDLINYLYNFDFNPYPLSKFLITEKYNDKSNDYTLQSQRFASEPLLYSKLSPIYSKLSDELRGNFILALATKLEPITSDSREYYDALGKRWTNAIMMRNDLYEKSDAEVQKIINANLAQQNKDIAFNQGVIKRNTANMAATLANKYDILASATERKGTNLGTYLDLLSADYSANSLETKVNNEKSYAIQARESAINNVLKGYDYSDITGVNIKLNEELKKILQNWMITGEIAPNQITTLGPIYNLIMNTINNSINSSQNTPKYSFDEFIPNKSHIQHTYNPVK